MSVTVDPPLVDAHGRSLEFVHYYANLLRLFRGSRPIECIERDALAAVALREARIQGFAHRLDSARRHFEVVRGDARLAARLREWDVERLARLRRDHGGVLIAAFHYGEHRHVLSDLCCLGIPFVAPVAKRSYFDATAVFSAGPPDCAAAPMLLEVERPAVGRRLLGALKQGRIGVVYVDGNMGPDGHLVEESGTEVSLLGERIRVKCGIARLALALKLPVLPLITLPRPDLPMVADRLLAFPAILPPGDAPGERERHVRTTMQGCYDALATAVAQAPEHWEFAFCLHRWLCSGAPPCEASPCAEAGGAIAVDPTVIVHYPRPDGVFWLNVVRQRAYRLPRWCADLYPFLRNSPRAPHEVAAHLAERGASQDDVVELIGHLRAVDLVGARASH